MIRQAPLTVDQFMDGLEQYTWRDMEAELDDMDLEIRFQEEKFGPVFPQRFQEESK